MSGQLSMGGMFEAPSSTVAHSRTNSAPPTVPAAPYPATRPAPDPFAGDTGQPDAICSLARDTAGRATTVAANDQDLAPKSPADLIAVTEVNSLTAAFLTQMPAPWVLVVRDAQGQDAVITSHQPSYLAAVERRTPAFSPKEYDAIVEAVELSRAWPDDWETWFQSKCVNSCWGLSRSRALGGAGGLVGPMGPRGAEVSDGDAEECPRVTERRSMTVGEALSQLGLTLLSAETVE